MNERDETRMPANRRHKTQSVLKGIVDTIPFFIFSIQMFSYCFLFIIITPSLAFAPYRFVAVVSFKIEML